MVYLSKIRSHITHILMDIYLYVYIYIIFIYRDTIYKSINLLEIVLLYVLLDQLWRPSRIWTALFSFAFVN